MSAHESFTIGGLPIEAQTVSRQSLDCIDATGLPYILPDACSRSDEDKRVSSGAVETVRNSKPHTDVVISVSDSRGNIFYLGSTRSRKSVIPQTFAKVRRESGRPMVNFLCFRGDSGDNKALLSTILEELFELYPEIKPLVHAVFTDNPTVSELPFSDQFNLLIRNPIFALMQSFAIQNPIVLCVDGPDGRDRTPEAKDARRAFISSIYRVTRGYSPFVILISRHPSAHFATKFDKFGDRGRVIGVDESRTSVSVLRKRTAESRK